MGLLGKVGKAMGHAMAQAGKKTVAAIKRKNLQNKVERMILERFTVQDLKKMFKEYSLPGPELPERGYYKKEDYVDYAYHHFKLKTVIEWAKRHRIKIKDIMEYYIAEMEKIDLQYGQTKAEDKEQGVEDINVNASDFVSPDTAVDTEQIHPSVSSTVTTVKESESYSDELFFKELLRNIKEDYGPTVEDIAFVDEMAFKNHLMGYLRWKYRDHNIRFQPQSVDLIIDNKFGIELKFAYNKGTLTKGYHEAVKYKKSVKYLAFVILDPGIYPEHVREAVEDYKGLGAEVIVIKGGRKRDVRRRRKERYLMEKI